MWLHRCFPSVTLPASGLQRIYSEAFAAFCFSQWRVNQEGWPNHILLKFFFGRHFKSIISLLQCGDLMWSRLIFRGYQSGWKVWWAALWRSPKPLFGAGKWLNGRGDVFGVIRVASACLIISWGCPEKIEKVVQCSGSSDKGSQVDKEGDCPFQINSTSQTVVSIISKS